MSIKVSVGSERKDIESGHTIDLPAGQAHRLYATLLNLGATSVIAYAMLAIAIVTEVIATLSLKASEGFSKLGPSIIVVAGYTVSFALLGLALERGLPMGLAYATWAAIGTGTIAILGVLVFGESLSLQAILGLGMIVVGVALLNLASGHGISGDKASSTSHYQQVGHIPRQ